MNSMQTDSNISTLKGLVIPDPGIEYFSTLLKSMWYQDDKSGMSPNIQKRFGKAAQNEF